MVDACIGGDRGKRGHLGSPKIAGGVRANERFRLEVAAATRVGMGRSAWLDSWTDADRAALIAYMQYEESICSGCGHLREKSFEGRAEDWDVHKVRCFACEAKGRAQSRAAEGQNLSDDTHGLYWFVTQREEVKYG